MSAALEGFRFTAKSIDNRNAEFPNSDAWSCKVTNPRGKTLSRQYFKGYGHHGAEPTLEEFMESMISDAECVDYRSEAEFAEEFGYDYNDREEIARVHKIYNACTKISERLVEFLTEEEREAFRED